MHIIRITEWTATEHEREGGDTKGMESKRKEDRTPERKKGHVKERKGVGKEEEKRRRGRRKKRKREEPSVIRDKMGEEKMEHAPRTGKRGDGGEASEEGKG